MIAMVTTAIEAMFSRPLTLSKKPQTLASAPPKPWARSVAGAAARSATHPPARECRSCPPREPLSGVSMSMSASLLWVVGARHPPRLEDERGIPAASLGWLEVPRRGVRRCRPRSGDLRHERSSLHGAPGYWCPGDTSVSRRGERGQVPGACRCVREFADRCRHGGTAHTQVRNTAIGRWPSHRVRSRRRFAEGTGGGRGHGAAHLLHVTVPEAAHEVPGVVTAERLV